MPDSVIPKGSLVLVTGANGQSQQPSRYSYQSTSFDIYKISYHLAQGYQVCVTTRATSKLDGLKVGRRNTPRIVSNWQCSKIWLRMRHSTMLLKVWIASTFLFSVPEYLFFWSILCPAATQPIITSFEDLLQDVPWKEKNWVRSGCRRT